MVTPRYRAPSRRSGWIELAKRAFYYGTNRFCTVCKTSLRSFKPYGHIKRADAICPVCDAVERHRFTWSFFEQRTDLFHNQPKRMLHVAPEPAFERRLRNLPHLNYRTADPQDQHVDLKLDITAIPLPDDSFDVIHCSHVLEHIQEDEQAMRELARVLAPGGWATILVPIIAEQTFDDRSVTDPEERARLLVSGTTCEHTAPTFRSAWLRRVLPSRSCAQEIWCRTTGRRCGCSSRTKSCSIATSGPRIRLPTATGWKLRRSWRCRVDACKADFAEHGRLTLHDQGGERDGWACIPRRLTGQDFLRIDQSEPNSESGVQEVGGTHVTERRE